MNRHQLVEAINEEISALQTASAILEGNSVKRTPIKGPHSKPRGYTMSASARKRIGDAQRARWAKQKADHAAKVKSGDSGSRKK